MTLARTFADGLPSLWFHWQGFDTEQNLAIKTKEIQVLPMQPNWTIVPSPNLFLLSPPGDFVIEILPPPSPPKKEQMNKRKKDTNKRENLS